jgi:hypothetical protein
VAHNPLDRPLDCGALEAKLQQWAAGKEAGIRIKVDLVVVLCILQVVLGSGAKLTYIIKNLGGHTNDIWAPQGT